MPQNIQFDLIFTIWKIVKNKIWIFGDKFRNDFDLRSGRQSRLNSNFIRGSADKYRLCWSHWRVGNDMGQITTRQRRIGWAETRPFFPTHDREFDIPQGMLAGQVLHIQRNGLTLGIHGYAIGCGIRACNLIGDGIELPCQNRHKQSQHIGSSRHLKYVHISRPPQRLTMHRQPKVYLEFKIHSCR